MAYPFKTTGPEDPADLAGVRRDVHWALQIAASPPVEQRFVTYEPERALFQSEPLPKSGARAALRVADLSVVALDGQGREEAVFPLDGATLDEGMSWMSTQLTRLEGDDVACKRPEGILPFHPVARGGLFLLTERENLVHLSRWCHNGFAVVDRQRAARKPDAELRCWANGPYLSFPFGALDDPETVHAGFCLGDRHVAAPYFFVMARGARRVEYEGPGMWMKVPGEFTGTVLPGGDVVVAGDASAQEDLVKKFFEASLQAVNG